MLTLYLSLLDTQEERDKFERIYTTYRPLLIHVAYDILHDTHLAEDAVQNAFFSIFRSLCAIDDSDCHKIKRFLVIVTENAAKDILRKKNRHPSVELEQVAPAVAITPDMLDGVAAEEIAKHIAALPEIYRIPLELKVYHGLSEKRIALVLGIGYAAVRKRLERARGLLGAALKKE